MRAMDWAMRYCARTLVRSSKVVICKEQMQELEQPRGSTSAEHGHYRSNDICRGNQQPGVEQTRVSSTTAGLHRTATSPDMVSGLDHDGHAASSWET